MGFKFAYIENSQPSCYIGYSMSSESSSKGMFTHSATKSYLVQYEQQRPLTAQSRSSAANIVPAWLAERFWCTKFQSLLFIIYFHLTGIQASLLLIYFPDGPNGCSHCTKVWRKTYSICDAPLSRLARHILAASQKSHGHSRTHIRYDFRSGAKAIQYSVNISLSDGYNETPLSSLRHGKLSDIV